MDDAQPSPALDKEAQIQTEGQSGDNPTKWVKWYPSITRVLWGCESSLSIIAVIVILGGICLLGIFNRPGKPLTIELPFPAPAASPSPTAQLGRLFSLTTVTTNTLLVVMNGRQQAAAVFDTTSGSSVTPTPLAASSVITTTGLAWSRDRANVAFVSEQDGRNRIFVVLSSTSGALAVPLTDTVKVSADTPLSWSLNGQRLAFVAREDRFGLQLSTLFVFSTTQPITPTALAWTTEDIYSPVWVDNDRIAYARTFPDGREQVILHSILVPSDPQTLYVATPSP